MDKYLLKAEERKILRRKVKKLRQDGILPANVYGATTKSMAVSLDLKAFEKAFSEVGETGLIDLEVGKEKRPVLVHNIQRDPVSDVVIHADFLEVDLKKKVEASVPVEIVGESPAEKQGLGTVVQQIDEVDVEALPADLPEKFEVDVSGLIEVDQAIFVKGLKYEKTKVEVKNGPEEIIVKVEEQKEEVEETPAPTEVEGEVAQEGGDEATQETSKEVEKEAKQE